MTAAVATRAAGLADETSPSRSMPTGVRDAVELLMSPQDVSDARWEVRSAVLVDHRVDDDQDTRITNLSAKHRRHHRHKSRGTWTAVTDADGKTVWRTLSGRTYVTHRYSYDDPLGRVFSDSDVEAATAAAHAADPFDSPRPYR